MIYPSKEFLKVFKETSGALSVSESISIMNIASEAPEGNYLELGVFHGKSALSALQSLKAGKFYLVDPIFENDEIKLQVFDRLRNNTVDIELVADISLNAIPKYDNYSYVFIDSADHDELAMKEVYELENRVIQGGIIALHDFDSQFRHVRMAYDYLVSTGKYQPIDIKWHEIIQYVKENDLERGNLSWHHTEIDFPCFVGAVKRLPML